MQRRMGESGFVLMEALVVSMLVAVTFLGLMGAIFTAIRSSDVNRHRQRMEAALTSYGETLKSMPIYLACGDNPADLDWKAAQPHLFGFDYNGVDGVSGVRKSSGMAWVDPPEMALTLQPGVEVLASDGTWSTDCPLARDNSGHADSGAQRLTIEVTSTRPGGQTITGQIVKTRPLS